MIFSAHLGAIYPSGIDLFPRHFRQEAEIFLFQLPPPNAECRGGFCERRFNPIIGAAGELFYDIFNDAQWKDGSRAIDIIFIVRS